MSERASSPSVRLGLGDTVSTTRDLGGWCGRDMGMEPCVCLGVIGKCVDTQVPPKMEGFRAIKMLCLGAVIFLFCFVFEGSFLTSRC